MALQSRLTLELKDADSDTSQTSFPGAILANDAAFPTQANKARTLQAELEDLTIGNVRRAQVAAYEAFVVSAASNGFAQTNVRWRFVYTDLTTGAQETLTLGTADLSHPSAVSSPAGTYIDLADVGGPLVPGVPDPGTGGALKAAFEDYVVSDAGNAVRLDRVEYVQ